MSSAAAAANEDDRAGLLPALREAGLTAIVAAALMLPLIGLHAATQATGIVIRTRWPEMLIAVALIFAGRLALALERDGRAWPAVVGGAAAIAIALLGALPGEALVGLALIGGGVLCLRGAFSLTRDWRGGSKPAPGAHLAEGTARYLSWLGGAMVVFAVVLPLMPFADRRLLDLATLVVAYVMLGWGLNIVVGLAGLLDLGFVAFYAVGAYSFALVALNFDMGFWVALPIAGALAALFGLALGFPVLRLRGDYLAIVTLGFGEMVRIVLINWVDFTRGPDGISGIPKPTLFGLHLTRRAPEGAETFSQFFSLDYQSVHRVIFLYYVVLAMALLTNLFIQRIRKLPIGRAWEALREDEIACRSLGLNPTNIKLSAFSLGAMFGGFAGALFASRQGFISPESFTFIESAIILAIVVLGGMGSQLGVAIAAIVLIGLPEWFRDLQEYRMLAFGALMVLIMIWRPRGLLSHREPTLRLHARGRGGAP